MAKAGNDLYTHTNAQFTLDGYEIRARRDRNKFRVGLIEYVQKGLICMRIAKYELEFSEWICSEITSFEKKSLLPLPQENFLYFRKRKPRKHFLCFLKKNLFFDFGKWEPRNENSEKAVYNSSGNFKAWKTNVFLYFSL